MDDLGYSLLVDKSLKRKVNIISMLLEAVTPLSVETIAQHLGVTNKTTQQDIDYLIERFPNNITLLTYNNNLSLFKKKNNVALIEYLNELTQENPLFFVIETIFNGEKYTIYDFTDKLFISESTFKKQLSLLSEVLSHYNLTLSISPIDIIGNEINLRYFYFQYFRYARNSIIPYLRDDQYSFIFNTVKSLTDNYGLVLNIDYYRVASWLLIFEKRLEQKRFITLPPSIHNKYTKKESYLKFKAAMLKHFSENPLLKDLTDSEILFCYLSRLDTVIYEENKSFFTDDFFFQFRNFDPLILSFFEKSNQSLSLNVSLTTILQAYLTNLTMLTELNPLFQTIPNKIKLMVKKKYAETVNIWVECLEEHMDFTYTYDVAINLTLLTESNSHKKKNILFVFTGEPASISFYKEHALKCTPYQMNPIFIFNAPLDLHLLEKMNIDLCVCNITPSPEIGHSKVFRLSNIPLESEWQELVQLLYNV